MHVYKFVISKIEVVSLRSTFRVHQCANVLCKLLVNFWTKPTDSSCYCLVTAYVWPENSDI